MEPNPTVPAQPSPTPIVPENRPKLRVLLVVILVLIVLGLATGMFLYQFFAKKNLGNLPAQTSQTPVEQKLSLDKKIIYGVLNSGNLKVFASDYSGNSKQLLEVASASAVFRISPDKTWLPVESKPKTLSLVNLKDMSSKDYPLEASSSGVTDLNWGIAGKEFLMIDSQNKLEKLSLVGGQIEDLGALGLFPIVADFLGLDNSGHTFLTVSDLCAPGPCFRKLISYDWQTGEIKTVLDFGKVDTGLKFADVNPNNKEALFNNGPMDVYNTANPESVGELAIYNFSDQKMSDLLKTKKVSYLDGQYIDSSHILYDEQAMDASASAGFSRQWFIFDVQSKQSKKVSYTEGDLEPFNQDLGLINNLSTDGNELDILDFNSGKKTQLYKGSGQVYILN